ncbi:MAG: RsmB/NOP family class I SAM-dependent RNA methyltransferase [Holosporaceae bacterium]|jgi:16S rRNA (cytosine967-C5)-methyltransferase|nr:RsmB/NOP family class I SAM-dependent RNA methyltransferase [Holosporaceae bacterium]
MQLAAHIQASILLLDLFFASGAPFDMIMAKFFKKNRTGSHDRRAIAEFSYTVFRNFEKVKFLSSRITSDLGRFYVLVFLKAIHTLSEAKINEIFSGKPYHPASLTEFERKFLLSLDQGNDFPENAKLNYPQWMTPLLKRSFSQEELPNEMLALNEKACVDLRVNTLKSSKDEVKKMLVDSGFEVEDCCYSTLGLRLLNGRVSRNNDVLAKGLAEIQDEGSQLVTEISAVVPGHTIVDFCAGAGGKTLAFAALMQNKGRIFALDKYEERLAQAKIRCRRANVSNVFYQQITGKWVKRHLECADLVLVDAPCSGSGTWRRNPDMRAKFTFQDLAELLHIQEEILESAHRLVKKNGKLIYATCSILKEENEDQVAKFLDNHPEFIAQKIELSTYTGNYLKLTPLRHKTDGFFAAILRKNL